MTTRFAHKVQCSCGHVGTIIMRENDAPFSSFWESYTPRDLAGERFETTTFVSWDDVFERMKLLCPSCGQKLATTNLA